MKNKIKILSAIVILVFQGCSNTEHDKLVNSKASLPLCPYLSTVDTVPMRVISSDTMIFEGAIKKSINNTNFNYISTYLDSVLIFSVKVNDKTYQNAVRKTKAIEAINNVFLNSKLIDYDLYVADSNLEDGITAKFYVLVLWVEFNGRQTDVNILFIMNNGNINTIRFY